ncbi:unnamed protein product [Orchesella dallaii]|uniref:Histone-lysine N-methyltransferase n=1 Tax=Orchesella dallaii TaxID=48710 RepID=A0ABP1QTV6_9HEXA
MSANQRNKGKAFLALSSSSNRIPNPGQSRRENDTSLPGKLPAGPIKGRRHCLTSGKQPSAVSTRKRRIEDTPGIFSTDEDDDGTARDATLKQLKAKKRGKVEVPIVKTRATMLVKQQRAANLENVQASRGKAKEPSIRLRSRTRNQDNPETPEEISVNVGTSNDSGNSAGNSSVAPQRRSSSRNGRSDSASSPKSQSHTPTTKVAAIESGEEDGTDYEVEEILDFSKNDKGVERFYVKWMGYPEGDNTWEPIENLNNCKETHLSFIEKRVQEIITAYNTIPQSTSDPNAFKKLKAALKELQMPNDCRPIHERIKFYFAITAPITEDEKRETLKKMIKKDKARWWSTEQIEKFLMGLLQGTLQLQNTADARAQLLYVAVKEERESQQKVLKVWEDSLNEITERRPKIIIENNADFEGPPQNFSYKNTSEVGIGVQIADHIKIGCDCKKGCRDKYKKRKGHKGPREPASKCCPEESGVELAYNKQKKLKIRPGRPIYECNDSCTCDSNCVNRVVQDGWTSMAGMEMCIFRTSNSCGWAVKTLKPIPKGTFVGLYAGEIINRNQAGRRAIRDGAEGMTYLFDLDFNQTKKRMA